MTSFLNRWCSKSNPRLYSSADSDEDDVTSKSSIDGEDEDSDEELDDSDKEQEDEGEDDEDEEEEEEEEEEEGEDGIETEEELQCLRVPELKELLRQRGLKVGGNKPDLIKRLLGGEENSKKKKGWKNSKAQALLTKHIYDENSRVHRMSPEEIYNSDDVFQDYPFDKFTGYLKSIRDAAKKYNEIVATCDKEIHSDLMAFPRPDRTLGGYPFWDTHAARSLLKKDVRDGKANEMKPSKLHESRTEYMEFPLAVFRDHVHQEKRRQREEPGWVHKRNLKAQKMHEHEVNEMKVDWDRRQNEKAMGEIINILEDW